MAYVVLIQSEKVKANPAELNFNKTSLKPVLLIQRIFSIFIDEFDKRWTQLGVQLFCKLFGDFWVYSGRNSFLKGCAGLWVLDRTSSIFKVGSVLHRKIISIFSGELWSYYYLWILQHILNYLSLGRGKILNPLRRLSGAVRSKG